MSLNSSSFPEPKKYKPWHLWVASLWATIALAMSINKPPNPTDAIYTTLVEEFQKNSQNQPSPPQISKIEKSTCELIWWVLTGDELTCLAENPEYTLFVTSKERDRSPLCEVKIIPKNKGSVRSDRNPHSPQVHEHPCNDLLKLMPKKPQ